MSTHTPPTGPSHDGGRRKLSPEELRDALARQQQWVRQGHGGADGSRGLDLSEREAKSANLTRRDLRNARFRNADLSRADFRGAALHGTDFEDAILRECDFSESVGLSEASCRGADLTGATLPSTVTFDDLGAARDLVARAERTLYLLLLTCASIAILAVTTQTHQLFRVSGQLTLPGISLPVPITTFFVLAPLVLLALHLSLSFGLRKLWLTLHDLPAVLPNGKSVDKMVALSNPNFAVLASRYIPHLAAAHGQTRAERTFTAALVWGSVPATLSVVWWNYLPRHDSTITMGHIAAFVVAVAASFWFHRDMRRVLDRRGSNRRRPVAGQGAGDAGASLALPSTSTNSTSPADDVTAITAPVALSEAVAGTMTAATGGSWFYLFIARRRNERGDRRRAGVERRGRANRTHQAWAAAAGLLAVVMIVTSAGAIRSTGCTLFSRPLTADASPCNRMLGANLAHVSMDSMRLYGANLRHAYLGSASLRHARLDNALLEAANLTEAHLDSADLKDAWFNGAILWEADFDGAELKEAHLVDADLRGASLLAAELQGADLRRADLRGARLTGAVLCGADLRGAKLAGAHVDTTTRGLAYAVRDRGLPAEFLPSITKDRADTTFGYLSAKGRRERRQWAAAWASIERVSATLRDAPRLRSGGRIVAADTLSARLDSIDLSMGTGTQTLKEELRQLIADAPAVYRHPGRVHYTARLRMAFDSLRATIRSKAAGHCVDVGPR